MNISLYAQLLEYPGTANAISGQERVHWSTGQQQKKVAVTFQVCSRLFPCQVSGCVFRLLGRHWFKLVSRA